MDDAGSAWRIRSVEGYTYDFNQYETYKDNGTDHKSAWYLTKITSPAGSIITYNYTALQNRYITSIGSYSESRDDYDPPVVFSDRVIYPTKLPDQKGMLPGKDYSFVILSNIDYPNGRVTFNYSDQRDDLPGGNRLDSISIFKKDNAGNLGSNPIKTIALSYSYFSNGIIDDDYKASTINNSKRLKLLQVAETGYYGGSIATSNPYKFTYIESSSDATKKLPSKTSFARDHWGYYNGKTSNFSLIPSVTPVNSPDLITHALGIEGEERNTDPNYLQAFTLSSIQYPTGGVTEFQYEANDFDEQKSQVNDHSYFAKKYSVVKQTTTLICTYPQTNTFSPTNTLDLSSEYVYTDQLQQSSTNVHLNVAYRFGSTAPCYFSAGSIVFEIYDSTGVKLLVSKDISNFYSCTSTNSNNCMFCGGNTNSYVNTYNTDLKMPPGKYVIKVKADNQYPSLMDIRFSFDWYQQTISDPVYGVNSGTFSYGGGLRIKKIINHDGISSSNDKIKKFIYHYQEDRNKDGVSEEYSYGRRMSRPGYSYFIKTNETVEESTTSTSKNTWKFPAMHLMRTSDSNNPLNGSAGGSVVGYDQVSVLEGENGENGKTTYQYINAPDVVSNYNDIDVYLPMRPPFSSNIPELQNGSLVKQTVFRNNGGQFDIIKEDTSIYNSVRDDDNSIFGIDSRPIQAFYTTDDQSGGSGIAGPCDRVLLCYLTSLSEWNTLASISEKLYNQNDLTKFTETLTTYYYDNSDHYLPTRVVVKNSKGEGITTTTKYPLDYANLTATDDITQGILNLQNKHVINAPVEKYVQKANADGTNRRTISGIITSYKTSVPLPSIAYTTESATPIVSFSPSYVNNGGLTKDATYNPQVSFDYYDNYGNILQQHKINDKNSAYIWDYNSSIPIAECNNASSGEIAYTSFEADGTGNRNIASVARNTADAITGKQSYSLGNGSISKSGLGTAKSYIVTFWSKNGSATVNSNTAATSINRNGWSYNQANIPAGTSSVTIGGSATIDELRLYPSNAQMSSYTYEPLIGVTSECDINNRINYYQYDGLGRLRLIRDQDKNIRKKFCYNYNGQPSNCAETQPF